MLSLEGPESYQPGYATTAHLLCLYSQVGHKPNLSLLASKKLNRRLTMGSL